MPGQLGSVNDISACKADLFVQALRNDPLYTKTTFKLWDVNGSQFDEMGLWLSVDGGYLRIPELIVGDPLSLDHHMNYFNHFMESKRKHIECGFGILKQRFRILKLPLLMHDYDEIDDMFFTCCILHNMCIDFDGADDGWNLGGVDGEFSDDENHDTYLFDGVELDLYPTVDHCYLSSSVSSNLSIGGDTDSINFCIKRDRLAHNWYYMFRHGMVEFNKK